MPPVSARGQLRAEVAEDPNPWFCNLSLLTANNDNRAHDCVPSRRQALALNPSLGLLAEQDLPLRGVGWSGNGTALKGQSGVCARTVSPRRGAQPCGPRSSAH